VLILCYRVVYYFWIPAFAGMALVLTVSVCVYLWLIFSDFSAVSVVNFSLY